MCRLPSLESPQLKPLPSLHSPWICPDESWGPRGPSPVTRLNDGSVEPLEIWMYIYMIYFNRSLCHYIMSLYVYIYIHIIIIISYHYVISLGRIIISLSVYHIIISCFVIRIKKYILCVSKWRLYIYVIRGSRFRIQRWWSGSHMCHTQVCCLLLCPGWSSTKSQGSSLFRISRECPDSESLGSQEWKQF